MRLPAIVFLSCSMVGLACSSGPVQQTNPEKLPSTVPIEPITYDALFVVNGGDHTISVIDTENLRVTGTIRIEDAKYPHHVYLNRDGSKMLVAAPGVDLSGGHEGHSVAVEGAVLMLDARTGRTLLSRRLPGVNHNAIFSPDETEVWTAQFSGYALVLAADSLVQTTSIRVGDGAAEVTFSHDGAHAFVANTASRSVSVVNPATKAIEATITVGNTPVGAWQGSNGIAYVDNEADGTLTAIDTRSLDIVQLHHLGFTPGMVGLGPDGHVWVADSSNGKVALRSTSDSEVQVAAAPAGSGAHGIAFNEGTKKTAYVSNQTANTVSVIDIDSRRVIATIPVGSKPNGMVWRKKS